LGWARALRGLGDLHVLPERHEAAEVTPDLVDGRGIRLGVGPCAVGEPVIPGTHTVVLALALPRAGVRGRAVPQHALRHRRGWEVHIAFDVYDVGLVGLRDHLVSELRLEHGSRLRPATRLALDQTSTSARWFAPWRSTFTTTPRERNEAIVRASSSSPRPRAWRFATTSTSPRSRRPKE